MSASDAEMFASAVNFKEEEYGTSSYKRKKGGVMARTGSRHLKCAVSSASSSAHAQLLCLALVPT